VITVPNRHRQTDRQTDRRTTYDGNTALCTKVHRAVKTQVYFHTCNKSTPLCSDCSSIGLKFLTILSTAFNIYISAVSRRLSVIGCSIICVLCTAHLLSLVHIGDYCHHFRRLAGNESPVWTRL